MKAYDVISGKIANDATNITITAYLDGLYGEIGSNSADSICISLFCLNGCRINFVSGR